MIDHHLKFKQKSLLSLLALLVLLPLAFLYYEYISAPKDIKKVFSDNKIKHIQDIKVVRKTKIESNLNINNFFNLRGTIREIVLSKDGQTAYLTAASRGIYIIDIHDPLNPKLISQFKYFKNSYDKARNILLSENGQTLFVRDFQAGIYSIDITNTKEPKLLATHPALFSISNFTISEDNTKLYISHSKGLKIADISNSDEIRTIANFNNEYKYIDVVEVKKDLLYLLSPYGVDILDVSSSNDIKLINKYSTLGDPEKIILSKKKNRAYISSGNSGIEILNLSNTFNPKPLGSYTTQGLAKDTSISDDGKTIYISDFNQGMEIIDVTYPYDAKHIQSVHTNSTRKGQLWDSVPSPDEQYLYLAYGTLGLAIVKLNQTP